MVGFSLNQALEGRAVRATRAKVCPILESDREVAVPKSLDVTNSIDLNDR